MRTRRWSTLKYVDLKIHKKIISLLITSQSDRLAFENCETLVWIKKFPGQSLDIYRFRQMT